MNTVEDDKKGGLLAVDAVTPLRSISTLKGMTVVFCLARGTYVPPSVNAALSRASRHEALTHDGTIIYLPSIFVSR